MVVKDILISKCLYFRRSLNGGSPETTSNEVYLTNDMSEAFNAFIMFLCSGAVNKLTCLDSVCAAFYAYTTADAFLMVELKNGLMDAIRTFYRGEMLGPELAKLLAKNEGVGGQRRVSSSGRWHTTRREASAANGPEMLGPIFSPYGKFRPNFNNFLAGGGQAVVDMSCAYYDFSMVKYEDPSCPGGCYYHNHPAGSPACKPEIND
jgi:hypothetical protein